MLLLSGQQKIVKTVLNKQHHFDKRTNPSTTTPSIQLMIQICVFASIAVWWTTLQLVEWQQSSFSKENYSIYKTKRKLWLNDIISTKLDVIFLLLGQYSVKLIPLVIMVLL